MCRCVCAALCFVFALGLGGLFIAGCGDSSVRSPFADRRIDAGHSQSPDSGISSPGLIASEDFGTIGRERDPTIGGSCVDDEQCSDDFECTQDVCHSDGLCRFIPNSGSCSDDQFCNGEEICDPRRGCVSGEPVTCDDGTPCTIDVCVEKTGECEHELRDADGDGDPDANCVATRGDCNDADPAVSSEVQEVCGNGRDDNCDGEADEADCILPQFDRCGEPFSIEGSGTYLASTEAAESDYGASCSSDGARDIALLIEVDEDVVDVELTAVGSGPVALAAMGVCGRAETETACEEGEVTPSGQRVARLRLRGLGRGEHSVLLFTSRPQIVELSARYLSATLPPANETCATAIPLPAGENVEVDLVGTQPDVASACEPESGDLLYFFDLEEPQDVRLFAASLDGYGEPVLSLRNERCARPLDEMRCIQNSDAQLFSRALPKGRYTVSVGASAPTLISLTRLSEPPSAPPVGDSCEQAEEIPIGVTQMVELAEFTDQVASCLPGGRERVYAMSLERRSDILLLQRLSEGDQGALTLAAGDCGTKAGCSRGRSSPLRLANHGLGPGSYRAIFESELGLPVAITAFTRPSKPPELVANAASCDAAQEIPATGGYFRGSTANRTADFSSGCDFGGTGGKGAPDQILVLELEATRRVVFDMSGSSYDTLLSIRSGDECPGKELVQGCSVGLREERSFLDINLEAGRYYVQIDGFAGAKGQWALDVFVAEPDLARP